MTDLTNAQVDAYLRQLDYALSSLPWEQRRELFADISQHIDSEIGATPGRSDDVEAVLARLGDPREIALAAGAAPIAAPQRSRLHEVAAIVSLAIGAFIVPRIGWFIGLALLWTSRRFTRADKVIGTVLVPFGYGALLLAAFSVGSSSSSETDCTGPLGSPSSGAHQNVEVCHTITTGGSSTLASLLRLIILLVGPTYTTIRLIRRTLRSTD